MTSLSRSVFAVLAVLAATGSAPAAEWKERVLFNFQQEDTGVGYNPQMGVLRDSDGLFGSSYNGGRLEGGTVYLFHDNKMRTIHSFSNKSYDDADGATHCGYHPTARLVRDAAGYVYGTNYNGGHGGGGVIFRLKPSGSSTKEWKCEVLHSFNKGKNHDYGLFGGLTLADDGTLYGTLQSTDVANDSSGVKHPTGGIVFSLKKSGGDWTFTKLHKFSQSTKSDGVGPASPLLLDDGVLYGVTFFGGKNNGGTVYKLMTDGTGFQVLHRFNRNGDGAEDGFSPTPGALVMNSDGYLIGATAEGGCPLDDDRDPLCHTDGSLPGGLLYKVHKSGSGFRVLHRFDSGSNNYINGYGPYGGLTRGDDGTLYGVAQFGGAKKGGVVFKVRKGKYSVVYDFPDSDFGFKPNGPLAINSQGKLIGTTFFGGNDAGGTVFDLTPP